MTSVPEIHSYFNPLPPCGGRPHLHVRRETKKIFQSTPSVWRETLLPSQQVLPHSFQSTPSVWRETAPVIHVTCQCRDFNPRPPCGGRRHGSQGRDGRLYTFQSTPSVWRETGHGQQDCRPYPISIHSLRVEGDASAQQQRCTRALFQSTPSVWRETNILQLAITHIVFQSTPSVWRETDG